MKRLSMLAAAACLLATVVTCRSQPDDSVPKSILFFGDSLTAGHTLRARYTYPALIEKRLKKTGWSGVVLNASMNGATTDDGVRRLDETLAQAGPVDAFVLALGANDVLRGYDVDRMEANLNAILDRVRGANPSVKLVVVGVDFAPLLGLIPSAELSARFQRVAERHQAVYVPDLLLGVANKPALNLSDGLHPNAKGMKIVAANVWAKTEALFLGPRSNGQAAARR